MPRDFAEQVRPAWRARIERREFPCSALGGHEPARAQVEHRVVVDGRARVAEKGFRVRRTRFLPQALRDDPRAIVLDARVQRRVRPEEERLALLLLAKLLLQVGEELGSLAGIVSGVHDQPQSLVVGFRLQLARVAAHAGERRQGPDPGQDGIEAGGQGDMVLQIAPLADGVPVRRVGHLVCQDGRDLRLVVHAREHSGVQVDPPVGQRECVQVRVAHDADAKRNCREHRGGLDAVRHLVEVGLERRVGVDQASGLEPRLGLLRLPPEPALVFLQPERISARRREARLRTGGREQAGEGE